MGPFGKKKQQIEPVPDIALHRFDVVLACGETLSFLTHEPSVVLQKLNHSVSTSDPLEYEWIPPSGSRDQYAKQATCIIGGIAAWTSAEIRKPPKPFNRGPG